MCMYISCSKKADRGHLNTRRMTFWVLSQSVTSICCSVAQSCLALCDPMDWSTPGSPVLHYIPESAQTHVHWVSDITQPSSRPLLSPSPLLLPSIFPGIRVFSNELALCIRWPKYWRPHWSPGKDLQGYKFPLLALSEAISHRLIWISDADNVSTASGKINTNFRFKIYSDSAKTCDFEKVLIIIIFSDRLAKKPFDLLLFSKEVQYI